MADNRSRGRGRRGSFEVKKRTDIVEYDKMDEMVYVTFKEKGTWQDEDQYFEFVDLANDMNNFKVLGDSVYGTYSEEEVEEITAKFEAMAEISGLSEFEISELQKYSARMMQYNDWISPIEEKIKELINSEDKHSDSAFMKDLRESIQGFAIEDYDKSQELIEEAVKLAEKYNEMTPELISQIRQAQEGMNHARDYVSEIQQSLTKVKEGIDPNAIASAAGDVASGIGKALGGALKIFRGKKKDMGGNNYDELFEEVNQILKAMPEIQSSAIEMERNLNRVNDEQLGPLEKAIDIFGNERTTLAQILRVKVEAMKELDYRMSSTYLPAVQEMLEDAGEGEDFVLKEVETKLKEMISEVKDRTNQLAGLQTHAVVSASHLDEAKEGVQSLNGRIGHYTEEVIPAVKNTLTVLTVKINVLKTLKTVAESKNLLEVLGNALDATAEAHHKLEDSVGSSAIDEDHQLEQLENLANRSAERTLRRLKADKENDEKTKRLMGAVDGQGDSVEAKTKRLLASEGVRDDVSVAKRANDNKSETFNGKSDKPEKAAETEEPKAEPKKQPKVVRSKPKGQ